MADAALLAFNFTLGIAAFFSPCGFPMLPAFVAYYLDRDARGTSASGAEPRPNAWRANLARGLAGGLLAGLGAFAALALVGSLAASLGAPFKEHILLLELIGGIVVLALGVLTLAGKGPSFTAPVRAGARRGVWPMLGFGALYAAAAAGCVAPLYLGVVLDALVAPTLLDRFLLVAAYGVGMASLLVAVTVAVSLAGAAFARRVNAALPWIQRASGVVLVLVGAYLVWYWYRVDVLAA